MLNLILYTKEGCHLCEGLQEKLEQIQPNFNYTLELRDITTRQEWFDIYEYEVPVLYYNKGKEDRLIPRPSPRLSLEQLSQWLNTYIH